MATYEMAITIEEFGTRDVEVSGRKRARGGMCLDAVIRFNIVAGDPGDHWTPPTGPETELESITVTQCYGETYTVCRMNGGRTTWFDDLDRLAEDWVCENWDKYEDEAIETADAECEAARDAAADAAYERRRDEAAEAAYERRRKDG